MRQIDADALKETIDREIFRHDTIDHVFQIIDDAPTIEPKRGRWIPVDNGHHVRCSECGRCGFASDNFCPNCGADMKGADDE